MINVKLLVLFIYIDISESGSRYCEICPSHTLCLYENAGPSPLCEAYDKAAALTKEDVQTILNKINQRRNFVAQGLARNLPSAANMNKIEWSDELAASAQRWADQCDSAVRPDNQDICRNLADTEVGQSIATVTGLSPGLSVKSFVEMWFMESLDYTGSVTYFNESEDSKTDHFTQLIWADTLYAGCGKARFSIDDGGTIVDRLVCNFAPRGNIRGKPIYTIGYPATQCKENSERDEIFNGLCKFNQVTTRETTATTQVTSLLRIVNLPNSSLMQEMELLRNDYKKAETNELETNIIRHQKMRHISNNTHLIQHDQDTKPASLMDEVSKIPARHDVIPLQHTISHLQNIHGAVYKTRSPNDQFRKHENIDETVHSYNVNGLNFRKHYINRQCTRNSDLDRNRNFHKLQSENDECTRRSHGNEYILTTQPQCIQKLTTKIASITSNTPTCECNSQKTTSQSTTPCSCNLDCGCVNSNNFDTNNHRRIPGELQYYDNIPDFVMHSSDGINRKQLLKHYAGFQEETNDDPNPKDELVSDKIYKIKFQPFDFDSKVTQRQHTDRRNVLRKQKYSHGLINPFERRKRLKRQIEDPSAYKSFWQIDDYVEQAQPKSLRYTTLSNNRRQKFRTNQRIRYYTEPITIKIKDTSTREHEITEKFLSFDELMHLRKNSGGESGYDLRRKGNNKKTTKKPATKATTKAKPTTTKAKATTKATTKQTTTKATTKKITTTVPTITTTAFKILKQCSRKVTCTWTAPTITGKDGQVFSKGQGGQGSRTPPGYVEGCSRTSTCTREFMNRNKFPNSTESFEGTPEDEDYCERRSLDLKRRDSDQAVTIKTLDQIEIHTDNPIKFTNPMNYDSTTEDQGDCSCDDQNTRKKRNVHTCRSINGECKERPANYNDYYFVMLSKILRMLENNKSKNKSYNCQCNESNIVHVHIFNYLMMFLLWYTC